MSYSQEIGEMLQSKGKRGYGDGSHEPTQAFATEPALLKPVVVGEAAHTGSRRMHDSTLLGLAPPPVYTSSIVTQPMAVSMEQRPAMGSVQRDDRSLAAILVLGTLIAMFSIAFSAVPERGHAGSSLPKPHPASSVAAITAAEPSVATVSPALVAPVVDDAKADDAKADDAKADDAKAIPRVRAKDVTRTTTATKANLATRTSVRAKSDAAVARRRAKTTLKR